MKKKHSADLLLMLSLFFGFGVAALLAVVMGANVYRNVQSSYAHNYDLRTSLLYMSQKLRQAENPAAARVERLDWSDALVLPKQVEGENYETWIFLGENQLREVTVRAGAQIQPRDGQAIMPLSKLTLETPEQGLLRLRVEGESGAVRSTWMRLG